MRIIQEILDLYRYELIDDLTRCNVENYLNLNYPEIDWIVEIDLGQDDIVITPKFRTPQEETFYRLKWS